jgi:hypothetical protein
MGYILKCFYNKNLLKHDINNLQLENQLSKALTVINKTPSNRREKLTELYLSDPKALPGKEEKPPKYSGLDRFASTIEINFDLATNAQIKGMETIEQGNEDVGYWDFQNPTDFNSHVLEIIKLRDSSSANVFKSYVNGTELIFS